MNRVLSLMLVLALLAAACGGDDDVAVDDTDDAATEETDGVGTGGSDGSDGSGDAQGDDNAEPVAEGDDGSDDGGSDDDGSDEGSAPSTGSTGSDDALCALGAEFEEAGTFETVTLLDGERFFETVQDAWGRVAGDAPGEIADDVAIITDKLDEMEAIFARYDYDVFDPDLQAEIAVFDTTAMDEASRAVTDYVGEVCGIDLAAPATAPDAPLDAGIDPDDLRDVDLDDPISTLTQVFGVDRETAECLVEELGGFDETQFDPTTLNDPICGTTLLEVVSGLSG